MSVELFNGYWAKVKFCRSLSSPRRALHEGRACQDNDVLRTLVYKGERSGVGTMSLYSLRTL